MDECVEMLACNLGDIFQNKWLQQSSKKMICLYKVTMDDLIRTFMQIINYKLMLEGGFTSICLDTTSLSLNITTKCGDPKLP